MASTIQPPPPTSDSTDVLALPWPKFVDWFRQRWAPGDHVALIGPTNSGKSTFGVHLAGMRRYVMALDPKGGDSTLARLQSRGFVRIETWPPSREVLRKIEEGVEPVRLIVGPAVRHRTDLPRLRKAIADALDGAFDMGGWTVLVDEAQVAADARMMNLAGPMERNMISARDRGVTMLNLYQRPARVPRSMSDQARWLGIWYTRDVDVVNRLAEMTGRSKAEIRGAVRGLEAKAMLLFSNDPDDPIVATRAPRA